MSAAVGSQTPLPQCQSAQELTGRYALRCRPLALGKSGLQDYSYTDQGVRILSVSPYGLISLQGAGTLDPRWNDNQWRPVTSEEDPGHFLLDQCHQLNKGQEGSCVQKVKSLRTHLFWMEPLSQ